MAISMFFLMQNDTQSPDPRNGDLDVPHYKVSHSLMEIKLREYLNYLYSRH